MTTKICGGCKIEKPIDEYHRSRQSATGYVSQCKECARKRAREWREANLEKANGRSRDWQRGHREHRKNYMEQYYAANREHLLEQNTLYNANNKEQRRETNKRYRSKTKSNRQIFITGIVGTARRNARLKNIEFAITPELIDSLMIEQNDRCCLTGFPFEYEEDENFRARPFAPSIDRKDSTGGYTPDNIQITCVMVNKAKNEYHQEMFDAMCLARAKVLNVEI